MPARKIDCFYCDNPQRKGNTWVACHGTKSDELTLGFDEEWLMCIRPSILPYRCQKEVYLEPYLPSRFARQFGYAQGLVGQPRTFAFRSGGSALDAWRAWKDLCSVQTGGHFKYPYPRLHMRIPDLHNSYCKWYSIACQEFLALGSDPSFLAGEKLIFDKVNSGGKRILPAAANSSMVVSSRDKGKRVAEENRISACLKRATVRLVIKPPSARTENDQGKESSESAAKKLANETDCILPATPGGSLSPLLDENDNMHSPSSDSSEKVMYESPEVLENYDSDHAVDMAGGGQPSPEGSPVDTDGSLRSLSGGETSSADDVNALMEKAASNIGSIRVTPETVTAVKVIANPVGGGELGESSGTNTGIGNNNPGDARIKRHMGLLHFLLGLLSDMKPQDYAEESPRILDCLSSLRSEGANIEVAAKYVDNLLDCGKQYSSALALSAGEQKASEIRPMLLSLEGANRADASERQLLKEEDAAETSLKLEIETMEREVEMLQCRLREKKALLDPETAKARLNRISSLDQRLEERVKAHAALVSHLKNTADDEAKKTTALESLKLKAAELLQGALDVLPA